MFTTAKNPRWTDSDHSRIILDVLFEGGEEEGFVEFVAAKNDVTTHGPMLFNFAVNGLFGPVADSDQERIIKGDLPTPEGYKVINDELVNIAAVEQTAESKLNCRLAELQTPEVIARAELDEAFAVERKDKLKTLLAVREQSGWPLAVEWPR